jgi:Ca-activated chloride channel family protein
MLTSLVVDYSPNKPYIKFIFSLLVISSLIVALANPQFGTKVEKVKRAGIEIMFALDISNSMLSNDIQPNRLDRAKSLLTKLIDGLTGDKVGIVIFAGDAFLQMPLTTDYSASKLLLSTISPELIAQQGTAIGAALDMSINSFSKDKDVSKVVLLISDGENHEDDAIDIAQEAKDKNIAVYTIGMGTPNGGPIPIGSGNFLKDENGEVVITKLSSSLLSEIAELTKGRFIFGDAKFSEIESFISDVAKMNKKEMEDVIYTEYDSKFYYFLWLAFALIIIEIFIFEKKSPLFSKLKLFED